MRKIAMTWMLLGLSGCDSELCRNDLINEIQSPDGQYVASVFERNCGATTPYLRVVSLRPAASEFEPDNDKDWVFTIHGKPKIRIAWRGNEDLEVEFSKIDDVPTMRETWRNIRIGFK